MRRSKLANKIVLITGGSAGLGRELANLYAEAGATVLLLARDSEKLKLAAEQIKSAGGSAEYYPVDVSDRAAVDRVAGEIIAAFGRVDVVVNNAGVGHNGELAEMSPDLWRNLIDTNFVGALNVTYAFLPTMIEQGGGAIVNVSTGQVYFRLPTWAGYGATKAALATFSEALSYELIKHRIRVTTAYPYMIDTGFYSGVEGETFVARKSMELLPYYSQTARTAAKKIFRAQIKGRRRTMVSPINWLGFIVRAIPPLAAIVDRIAAALLVPALPADGPKKTERK